jgi:hypothetical protein
MWIRWIRIRIRIRTSRTGCRISGSTGVTFRRAKEVYGRAEVDVGGAEVNIRGVGVAVR